jgi:ABC-2 type transport system ATP-binding protein
LQYEERRGIFLGISVSFQLLKSSLTSRICSRYENAPPREKWWSLAERLELDLDRKTHELSKGNKLKIGIVQALMADQELIIMDESSGLDPIVQQELYRVLR